MPRLRTEGPRKPKRLGPSEFPRLRKDLDFHKRKNQSPYEKETVFGGTETVVE